MLTSDNGDFDSGDGGCYDDGGGRPILIVMLTMMVYGVLAVALTKLLITIKTYVDVVD